MIATTLPALRAGTGWWLVARSPWGRGRGKAYRRPMAAAWWNRGDRRLMVTAREVAAPYATVKQHVAHQRQTRCSFIKTMWPGVCQAVQHQQASFRPPASHHLLTASESASAAHTLPARTSGSAPANHPAKRLLYPGRNRPDNGPPAPPPHQHDPNGRGQQDLRSITPCCATSL